MTSSISSNSGRRWKDGISKQQRFKPEQPLVERQANRKHKWQMFCRMNKSDAGLGGRFSQCDYGVPRFFLRVSSGSSNSGGGGRRQQQAAAASAAAEH
jgi:hypothetical protein